MNDLLALFIGVLLNIFFKEPTNKYHPVAYIGKFISYFEDIFYKKNIANGIFFYFFIQSLLVLILYFIMLIFNNSFLIKVAVFYSFISVSSMIEHSTSIYNSLKQNENNAKEKLQMIVSRDVKNMNEKKIISSTIESIGENFNDAFFAPVFYSLFFGVYGALIYRITNTLDAMIGYKNDKYEKFGKFSAKADDFLNFIPSRLQFLVIIPIAQLIFNSGANAYKTMLKYKHSLSSPNSAYGISIFAGVLNIALCGNTFYEGKLIKKPVIQGGEKQLSLNNILEAILLYKYSALFTIFIIGVYYVSIYF